MRAAQEVRVNWALGDFTDSTREEMAKQNRGNSKQDYQTPEEFLLAVEVKFDKHLCHDLAATDENRVQMAKSHFGPGSWLGVDSLQMDWMKDSDLCDDQEGAILWLNPPYENIAPWAEKASKTKLEKGVIIAMLVPASVSTDWWAEHVHEQADVYFIRPRLKFQGCKDPYPKDLALVVYTEDSFYNGGSYQPWKWDEE